MSAPHRKRQCPANDNTNRRDPLGILIEISPHLRQLLRHGIPLGTSSGGPFQTSRGDLSGDLSRPPRGTSPGRSPAHRFEHVDLDRGTSPPWQRTCWQRGSRDAENIMNMPTHSVPQLCAVDVASFYLGSFNDGLRVNADVTETIRRRELGV